DAFIWFLALVMVPGMFLVIQMSPQFQSGVLRARVGRAPALYVDDVLGWMIFLLTTYSVAGTGFITVLAWDALTFDRRDAMVLGPLPLGRTIIIAAKLAALGVFLSAASIPINLLNAATFASATSDQLGAAVLVKHFIASLAATMTASVFIFSAIVTIRSTVALIGGPHLTSALGPFLQFFFVVALLSLVILCPGVSSTRFVTNTRVSWMPPAWFTGVFWQLRG